MTSDKPIKCEHCGEIVEPDYEDDEWGATAYCPECGGEMFYLQRWIEE